MRYKITKTQLNTLMGNLKRILKLGDGIILSGDCMHPVCIEVSEDDLEVNGNTTVKTVFPFSLPNGVSMLTVINLSDVLAQINENKKNFKEVQIIMDDNTIRIGMDNTEVIIATTHKTLNGRQVPPTYSDFNTLKNAATKDNEGNRISTYFSAEDLDNIRNARPVNLTREGIGTVRVSRNLFSLSGPLRKTGEVPFAGEWNIVAIELPDDGGTDYVLSLHVAYKEMEAIHLYAVTPF